MIRLLQHSADELEQAVLTLQPHFLPPNWTEVAEGVHEFRHERCDDLLMSFLKCVRCVSLLRASTVLLEYGFYQEVGILGRCISDSSEDVMFLATPLGDNNGPSRAQERLVEEFFREEFDDPNKPVGSQPERRPVPREQVLAGIARMSGNPLNPSDCKEITRALHKSFSGYVHGAYPHIMELFSAPPDAKGWPNTNNGSYAVSGGIPWQRLGEMAGAIAGRALQALVAVSMVAKRVNEKAVEDRLQPVLNALSKVTGADVRDVNKAAKAVKAGKSVG